MFAIGDKVSVLDDAINGIVLKINGALVTIETEDGFELNFNQKELIRIHSNSDFLQNIAQTNFSSVAKEKEIPKPRSFVKEKKSSKDDFVLEIDLHIEKLVPNKRGMSNYDILNIQTETIKRQMDFAQRNRIPKVVFIHGVGEGVLKSELDFLLGRYENISFQDANYQKYGVGATEVYFIQKKKLL
ncbi:Smr/MutS family protein [Flavobacterium sp.]|uniref:Smr/MutS family protein n=1 Tax=Flavobacterium sp. TaxID=239 RepID=UPI00286E80DB|nr:Smr/MutS family protein [Flavobacterium sp.]